MTVPVTWRLPVMDTVPKKSPAEPVPLPKAWTPSPLGLPPINRPPAPLLLPPVARTPNPWPEPSKNPPLPPPTPPKPLTPLPVPAPTPVMASPFGVPPLNEPPTPLPAPPLPTTPAPVPLPLPTTPFPAPEPLPTTPFPLLLPPFALMPTPMPLPAAKTPSPFRAPPEKNPPSPLLPPPVPTTPLPLSLPEPITPLPPPEPLPTTPWPPPLPPTPVVPVLLPLPLPITPGPALAVAVIEPALKFPEASRFTIAFPTLELDGTTFQLKLNVPLLVTGEPLTTKSDAGAARPTFVMPMGRLMSWEPSPKNFCAITLPIETVPLASLFTMELGVLELVGAMFQLRFNVPLPVTGEPVTTKSEAAAVNPTLVTVPPPPPPPGRFVSNDPSPIKCAAVIEPALKLPLASRFTMALAVFEFVGAMFQFKFSVPLPVMGAPVTTKSEAAAEKPTLVTVPPALLGKFVNWEPSPIKCPLLCTSPLTWIPDPVTAIGEFAKVKLLAILGTLPGVALERKMIW